MLQNCIRFVLMAILLLLVILLASHYSPADVDSAPGQPTPVLDLFDYLPHVPNAPTPTPTPRPTPAPPTSTPTPTPTPTPRPTATGGG